MKKKTKKKYAMGTGKNGVVKHYIESPSETLVENDIAIAKAKQKAANNGLANGLDIFGNMALQYGMGMAGGAKGVGEGINQGFGNMFGGQQKAAFGGPIGPGEKKKTKKRNLTEEEIADEVAKQNKKDVFDPNEVLFTAEGLSQIFGGEDVTYEEAPEIDLGKYGKVGYFKVDRDGAGRSILNNTKKNPANIDLYKEQKDYIRKRNPNAKFSNEGFTPLINQKAFGGSVHNVNVEVEGQEVGETPDGQLIDFQGPSHENGGIDVNLPEGTEIFSKRIKVKGETMAERKVKRENKLLTLEKLLEKNKDDNTLKNSIKRTIKNNKKEEEKDQNIQDVIGGMKQITQLAYGTGSDGIQTYRDGGSVIGDFFRGLFGKNNSAVDPITGFDPEYAKKQMGVFKSDNASNTTGTLDSDEISGVTDYSGNDRIETGIGNNKASIKNNTNFLPNLTGGDILGLAGTAFSAFQPMKNTQANRAGDTSNINAFEDFGNDALDRIDDAKSYVGAQRDKALTDLESARTRSTLNNRKSARGVNTQRALDLASDVNANNAQNDIYDNFSKQMMGLLSQQAGFENQQDSAVMQGEQNRDLADRQDRDNYFTQMAQDIATKGEGIQTLGKMVNQNKANTAAEQAVNDSSINFKYDNGTLTDKAGNVVMTQGQIAKSAKALNMTVEQYINMINKQKNG